MTERWNDEERGSCRMSETHYSCSKQRFMFGRSYYRQRVNEENAGERELEESHALFIWFLAAFTLISSNVFFICLRDPPLF